MANTFVTNVRFLTKKPDDFWVRETAVVELAPQFTAWRLREVFLEAVRDYMLQEGENHLLRRKNPILEVVAVDDVSTSIIVKDGEEARDFCDDLLDRVLDRVAEEVAVKMRR